MEPAPENPTQPFLGQSPASTPTLMVVDDDFALRTHTRFVLEAAGYRVLAAESGEEAVTIAGREPLDGVLLDLHMPGMGGVEACRRLRKTPGQDMLPIVMITGENAPKAIASAFEAGATDFVEKPVRWEVVRHRLQFLVQAKRIRDRERTSAFSRAALVQALPQTILAVDAHGTVRSCRPAVDDPSPVDWGRLVGAPLSTAIKASQRDRIGTLLCSPPAERGFIEISVESAPDWGARTLDLRSFQDADGSWVVMVGDWTDQLQTERELKMLAFRDQRTGLPNARALDEALDQAIAAARLSGTQVQVVRIALQRLDGVGETLGASAFDRVLAELVARVETWGETRFGLASSAPHSRWTLARTARCEFTLCLQTQLSEERLRVAFGDLERRLGVTCAVDEHEFSLGAALGVARFPEDGDGVTSLLASAGLAARRAGQSGEGGCGFYSAATRTAMLEHLTMESRLRRAIQGDRLHLVYQPKVDAADCSTRGVEALLRWEEPDLGTVSPATFIPVAESSGLIVALGEYVVEKACRQHRAWLDAGLPAPAIAVNLSAVEMRRTALVDRIQGQLRHHGLGSGALEVEITETAAIQSEKDVLEMLERLADLGVKSAIDDFGTGYASIRYLHLLPVAYIKVDRSFVKDLPRDHASGCITSAIIDLSHALGKRVIAEGVEDAAQLAYLSARGCDMVQGYLTGKPMQPDAIAAALAGYRTVPTCAPHDGHVAVASA